MPHTSNGCMNIALDPALDVNEYYVATTADSTSIPNMFTPIAKNGGITVIPSITTTPVPSLGGLGILGNFSPDPGYLNFYPTREFFSRYIKHISGKVLVCYEKIEKQRFVVARYYALHLIFLFLGQVPESTPLNMLKGVPTFSDDVFDVYWRRARKNEVSQSIVYDEADINTFLDEMVEKYGPLGPHGVSGYSAGIGISGMSGMSGISRHYSDIHAGFSASAFTIGNPSGNFLTIDQSGNMSFNGNVSINGTLSTNKIEINPLDICMSNYAAGSGNQSNSMEA